MPNLTLSIPEELKKHMEEFKEINWSEVARESIRKRTAKLAMLKALDSLIDKRPELKELASKLKASPDDPNLQLELSNKLLKNSKLAEEDVEKLSADLKERVAKRHGLE